jgi:hypothetical protein
MLLLAFTLAIAGPCRPSGELAERRADACRLTGGRPDVAKFASCTTRKGSCVWTVTYRSCVR